MSELVRSADSCYYEVVSNEDIKYSIYEGKTIDGINEYTSDIVFIMLDDYCIEANDDVYFVNFMYGASFIGKDKDFNNALFEIIDNWEKKNPDIIKKIKEK